MVEHDGLDVDFCEFLHVYFFECKRDNSLLEMIGQVNVENAIG